MSRNLGPLRAALLARGGLEGERLTSVEPQLKLELQPVLVLARRLTETVIAYRRITCLVAQSSKTMPWQPAPANPSQLGIRRPSSQTP